MFSCLGITYTDSETRHPSSLKHLTTEICAWKQDLHKSGYIHKLINTKEAVAMGGEKLTNDAINFNTHAKERYARYFAMIYIYIIIIILC